MTHTSLFIKIAAIWFLLCCIGCSSSTDPGTGINNTLSFSSTRGNLSASGTIDQNSNAISNSGVGAFWWGDTATLVVIAYKFNSSNDVSIAVVGFIDAAGVQAKSYTIDPTASVRGAFGFVPHIDSTQAIQVIAGNMSLSMYMLNSGTAVISSLTSDHVQGTFSGTGALMSNSSETISVSGGQFNAKLEFMNDTGPEPPKISKFLALIKGIELK